MTIYDIDNAITALIDEETGEIMDFEAFEALNLERDTKIENMALWVKDLDAETSAIADEIKKLTERKKAAENKAKNLREYLNRICGGEKFKTARCAISFRTTQVAKLDPEFLEWAKGDLENNMEYLTFVEPKASTAAVKKAMLEGKEFKYAHLETNVSTIIK